MGKMREILFRGRDSEGTWHEGIPVHEGDEWYFPNDFGSPKAYSINPETIKQYTGLTNDVGVQIFEDDILEVTIVDTHEKYRVVVRFGEYYYDSEMHYGWFLEMGDYACPFPQLRDAISVGCEIAIIGNIYDNPELMEEER